MANDPVTQMVQDPDLAKLSVAQQRSALAAHDDAFGKLSDDQIVRFVQTHQTSLSPEQYAAQQAKAQLVSGMNVPPSQMIAGELKPSGPAGPGPQESPFTEGGQRKAALGENYNDYMKQSGVFAGTTAGTMLTGGATLPLRMATTGAGAGVGAAAGGATPLEATETAASAALGQPIAEGATALGGALVKKFFPPKQPVPITEEWARINAALGVKPSAIRIGENATDLSQAATMPGRALAKAGLTSEQLEKMTPLEQQAAIQPIRARAAAELDAAFKAATDSGATFDAGKSVFDVLKKIKSPKAGVDLQQQATDTFNAIAEEAGITNQRATTPQQARQLRQLLSYNARFGQGGDLSSLAPIRAELYRAVNRDLHAAVPGLQDLDQFYSDVKGASVAARNGVAKAATKAPAEPPSSFLQETYDTAKAKALPYALGGLFGGAGAWAGKKLYDYATAGNP